MIVVDANIIAYFFLPSERTEQTLQVFQTDKDWAVPLLWRSELRNMLVTQIRQGRLKLTQALDIMDDAGALLSRHERDVPTERVLAFAQMSTLTAYDCEYVALASGLSVPLVTVDKRIVTQFPDIATTPEKYLRR